MQLYLDTKITHNMIKEITQLIKKLSAKNQTKHKILGKILNVINNILLLKIILN